MITPELAKKVKQTKSLPFSLPKDVSFEKTLLPEGVFAYVFRHKTMGELGRLVVFPRSDGQSQITCEVAGDPDDPLTDERRIILEPIIREMLEKMEMLFGNNDGEGQWQQPNLQASHSMVESKMMPCGQCGKPAALLIFADDAEVEGQLADFARKMYKQVRSLSVPTWVIGEGEEILINGSFGARSLVLKVFPEFGLAEYIVSTEFNQMLDRIMMTHCKK